MRPTSDSSDVGGAGRTILRVFGSLVGVSPFEPLSYSSSVPFDVRTHLWGLPVRLRVGECCTICFPVKAQKLYTGVDKRDTSERRLLL